MLSNATRWALLCGVMLIMLAFATAAVAKPGHLRPNDRDGIHGVGK